MSKQRIIKAVSGEAAIHYHYDALSRLTSVENMGLEGYGSIGYDYNLGGDRTARNYTPIDGTVEAALYNYDSSTARLTDITQAGSTLRLFGYDESGSIISDTRSDDVITTVFDYSMDARGRLATVSQDGALSASYTYDMSEQRIVKAVSGETAIHYHYDGEGRLISETDAATGVTIRDYVWLGLTPIASFGPANDNNPPSEPENCDEQEIATLQAMLTSAQDELSLLQSDLADHEDTRVFRLERIAQMEAELETLTGKKREKLADKIAGWTEKVDKLDGKITDAATAITGLEAMILQLETDIAAAQAVCDGSSGTGGGSGGTGTQSGVTFLHSDHLGCPKFATNADGNVVWDEGITTPFGIQITAMAAQTQALMFPGQYQDLETTGAGVTLSHNWHRTYDPTLGRYLQSDPIGLAGGLNRYAYVGGNPLGYVDPTGLFLAPEFQVALDLIG